MNKSMFLICLILGVMAMGVVVAAAAPLSGSSATALSRAEWLLGRGALADQALVGFAGEQMEIGGGVTELVSPTYPNSGKKVGLHILSSLILPGSGEAMMGYKRGYLMMAADIFAWTQVFKNNSDGDDIQAEFFAYADAHWSEQRLAWAYDDTRDDAVFEGESTRLGLEYFIDVDPVYSVDDFDGNLPLWVGREADHWEYYENLGKWDQFVFGWDDFVNPYDTVATGGYEPTGTLADFHQPFTSAHRDFYREMRGRSDDAYSKRDTWLVVNIGLRVFSVLQTAYLDGVMGGGPSRNLEVSGHQISFLARPMGWDRGTMAAAVSF